MEKSNSQSSLEARVWQIAGLALVAIGAALLFGFWLYGIRGRSAVSAPALNVAITAAFLLLVGLTTFAAGRALRVEDRPIGPAEARLWNTLSLASILTAVATVIVAQFLHDAPPLSRIIIGFAILAAVLFRMASRLSLAQQEILQQRLEIQKQQQLAESLLLNTLPAEIATELKAKGVVEPRYHEDVTILFTDFQGFTLSTEKLAAEELVQALHQYFTAFDSVIARYSLEKLKTIGDSYMCVAGLPERRPSHAVDALLAAFELVREVLNSHKKGLPPWNVRVGVHTGPVISGVVGVRKFAFDIWGESVNFASRMESSGHPNRINLSASTYTRVKDFFECEYRGKVATKEGREFDMYFAVGVAPSLKSSNNVVEAFANRYRTYFHQDLPSFPDELSGSSLPPGQN